MTQYQLGISGAYFVTSIDGKNKIAVPPSLDLFVDGDFVCSVCIKEIFDECEKFKKMEAELATK